MLKRNLTLWVSVVLLLLLSSCSLPKSEPQDNPLPEVATTIPEVPTTVPELPTKSIAYGDKPENLLDVDLPAGSGSFPVILLIHGTDVKKNYFVDTFTTADLVENGYATVSIHYRAPTADSPIAAMQDAACALAWIYTNSQSYAFDAQNIIVFGHSRGASMAALLSTLNDLHPLLQGCAYKLPDANIIKATVTYGGSYGTPEVSFSDPTFINALKTMSGLNDEQVKGLFDLLSAIPSTQWLSTPEMPEMARLFAANLPIAWLDGNEPPFLVVHGEIDELAPVAEAQAFAAALQSAGVPTTLAILPGMYHRLNQESLHEPLFTFLGEVTTASE